MRLVKILLVALLAIVSALYLFSSVSDFLSGDDVPPEIHCSTDVFEISVNDDDSILYSGITATDEQDGDLTSQIRISGISKMVQGICKVNYLVFDSDQNMASFTRQIRYTDYTSPRFALSEGLIYTRDEDIVLLDRLTASDVVDGDITGSIRVSSLQATSEAEVYTMNVQVTNSLGDTVRLTLPVIQLSNSTVRPEVVLRAYLLYLPTGSSFNASDYLNYVTTPEGRGDKASVQITGTVDTATPGTYMVHYVYPYGTTVGRAVLTVVVE